MSGKEEPKHNFQQSITCIKFPGVVEDSGVAKALQTMGGCLGISQAVSYNSQRLELNFNPKHPYHKSVYGDREKISAVLLKVKRGCPKAEVVGVVSDCFSFKNMCDFQFLPPENPETSVFPIQSLPNPDQLLSKEVPTGIYLPAPSLSRMDTPSGYNYSNRSNIHGPRPSRKNHTQRIPFTMVGPFPSSPLQGAYRSVEVRKQTDSLESVKALFEERPIWTRAALMEALKIDRRTLGSVLPCVAFFFQGGPWRLTWCKHGYDPRIDSKAARWQTIEFRAQSFELRKHLKLKSSDKVEGVKFSEGTIPSHLNCLYQLADIELKEVQGSLLTPNFKVCHEKYGWLALETLEKIRKLIDENANDAVIQRFGRSAPEAEEEADESDDSLVVLDHQNPVQSADESDGDSDF